MELLLIPFYLIISSLQLNLLGERTLEKKRQRKGRRRNVEMEDKAIPQTIRPW